MKTHKFYCKISQRNAARKNARKKASKKRCIKELYDYKRKNNLF